MNTQKEVNEALGTDLGEALKRITRLVCSTPADSAEARNKRGATTLELNVLEDQYRMLPKE